MAEAATSSKSKTRKVAVVEAAQEPRPRRNCARYSSAPYVDPVLGTPLTAKRRAGIILFKQSDTKKIGSEAWVQRLYKSLRAQDRKITEVDLRRWIKSYPWICDPNNKGFPDKALLSSATPTPEKVPPALPGPPSPDQVLSSSDSGSPSPEKVLPSSDAGPPASAKVHPPPDSTASSPEKIVPSTESDSAPSSPEQVLASTESAESDSEPASPEKLLASTESAESGSDTEPPSPEKTFAATESEGSEPPSPEKVAPSTESETDSEPPSPEKVKSRSKQKAALVLPAKGTGRGRGRARGRGKLNKP